MLPCAVCAKRSLLGALRKMSTPLTGCSGWRHVRYERNEAANGVDPTNSIPGPGAPPRGNPVPGGPACTRPGSPLTLIGTHRDRLRDRPLDAGATVRLNHPGKVPTPA